MINYFNEIIEDVCDYVKNNKNILLFIFLYVVIKNITMEIYEVYYL